MSRIGERKLVIPANVTVSMEGNELSVKGPKGELKLVVDALIDVKVEDNTVITKQKKASKRANVMQGTVNSLINNMLIGTSTGFTKSLEAVGVGYRFNVQGNKITINAGYSHPVIVNAPEGISVTSESTTEITLHGIDKQKVSEFAAKLREVREPEPYKGKGIRYKDEHVRHKDGKKAA